MTATISSSSFLRSDPTSTKHHDTVQILPLLVSRHAKNFLLLLFLPRVRTVSDLHSGMTSQRRLQIFPQAARTRNITILHRFFRRHRPLGIFIVNERTSRYMKQL